jgi:hypothetical protein
MWSARRAPPPTHTHTYLNRIAFIATCSYSGEKKETINVKRKRRCAIQLQAVRLTDDARKCLVICWVAETAGGQGLACRN